MLDAFPIYHWFHNGNPYSGAEQGMRYVITPGKKADPADESGKRKIEFLTVTVWPGPWSVEDAAVAWLHECYKGDMPRWTNIPSILDCEPDR